MENSSIFEFDQDSTFLVDLREKNYKSLIKDIVDFNQLVPTDNEILALELYADEIINNNIELEEKEEEIPIIPDIKKALSNFVPGIKNIGNYAIILDIINKNKKRENISLKSICSKYKKITNNSISKSAIFYILKNKLNYKYLRTTTKCYKLNNISSKIRAFIFIKIIIKAFINKMNIIFIDETNIQIENNHLKVWRLKNECPYFHSGKRGRKNVIMAISSNAVLHYEINNGTNNSNTFYDFMEALIKKTDEKKLKNSIIVMDNCTIHLTKKLREFYNSKKLKVLTIVPYLSQFNGIEFYFNFIKQKLYKKVFNSFNKIIPFVKDIINDINTEEVLSKIFVKTIRIYKEFVCENKSLDLNNNAI